MKNSDQNNTTEIKKLNLAEFMAWTIFFGIGLAYVVLTLVLPNNVSY
ncbi:MAG: hypothetical protein ABJG68_02510 [Crocinitomicaceae bacterium]